MVFEIQPNKVLHVLRIYKSISAQIYDAIKINKPVALPGSIDQ